MSWFEFPHTRTYDSDLGWIIANLKQNIDAIKWLQRYAETHEPEYEELKEKVDALVNGLVDVIEPWDSSIEYPIYSIVSYLGQNYIAIRPVPVGAMITNEYYWQMANTVVEQINAIGHETTNILENRWYVTPEMFGAVGDGETDDTAAIAAAIESIHESGKTLIMPYTYKTDTIVIPYDNLKVACLGEIVYEGDDCAVKIQGWYNAAYFEKITSAAGGILVTPNGKSVYLADIRAGEIDAVTYGIKFKDYVNGSTKYGILYNRFTCNRIDSDQTTGHAVDFESGYFIGETMLSVNLINSGLWAMYAVCTGTDGINAIRTDWFGMEGPANGIYLDNVHACTFNNLRYNEMVDRMGGMLVRMVNRCHSNLFTSPTLCKIAAIDTSGITAGETKYNTFNLPISNASNRIIAEGARANGNGLKFLSGFLSTASIGAASDWDYYPANFNGVRPTQLVIGKAMSGDDCVRIHLDDTYSWDGINHLRIIMNDQSFRCKVYLGEDQLVYDFTQLAGNTHNGIYDITFNRSTDTVMTATITHPALTATVGGLPA